jgi:hypothetical protein
MFPVHIHVSSTRTELCSKEEERKEQRKKKAEREKDVKKAWK